MSKWLAVLTLALGASTGYVVGVRAGGDRFDALNKGMARLEARVAELAREQSSRSELTRVVTAGPFESHAELAAVVHDVVRDELHDLEAERRALCARAEVQPEPVKPSAEQIEAEAAAQQLVAKARQTGFWSYENRNELRRLYGGMTGEQQERLMKTLLPAINSGEIKTDGPPL